MGIHDVLHIKKNNHSLMLLSAFFSLDKTMLASTFLRKLISLSHKSRDHGSSRLFQTDAL